MAIELNRNLAHRFIDEAWNQGDLTVAESLLDANFIHHEPDGTRIDRAGFTNFVTGFRTAFPDLHFTIEDTLADGDRVATRVIARGTQHGAYRGVLASGQPTVWTGIGIIRIADGQFIEQWADTDTVGAAIQAVLRPAQPQPITG